MNDAATAATETQTETQTGGQADTWKSCFGTLTEVVRRTTRDGKPYALVTVDCKVFTQRAVVFPTKKNPELVNQVLAAGEGAKIWMKGPLDKRKATNAQGGTYTVESMKVVYFSNKSDTPAGGDAPAEAPAADAPAAAQAAPAVADNAPAPAVADDEMPF